METENILKNYEKIRSQIKPGDIVAFSGKGLASSIIKLATGSSVSHVGVILRTSIDNTEDLIQIIESTSLDNKKGVMISRFSDRLRSYDGSVWLLPLNASLRKKYFDINKFIRFMLQSNGKEYDFLQAIRSGKRLLEKIGVKLSEDYNKMFCSELATAALEEAGLLENVNASGINPQKLCEFAIYDSLVPLKLEKNNLTIKNFNTNNTFTRKAA